MQDNYSLGSDGEFSDVSASEFLDGDDDKPSSGEENNTNDGPSKGFPSFSKSFGVVASDHNTDTREDDHKKSGKNDERRDRLKDVFENTKDSLNSGNVAVWTTETFCRPFTTGSGVGNGNEIIHGFDYTKKAVGLTALF